MLGLQYSNEGLNDDQSFKDNPNDGMRVSGLCCSSKREYHNKGRHCKYNTQDLQNTTDSYNMYTLYEIICYCKKALPT